MTLSPAAAVRHGMTALLIGLYAAFTLTAAQLTHHGVGVGGTPLFYDFEAFYEAGRFVLRGDASGAYDDARMIAAQHAVFPGMTVKLPWNYPPTVQLLMTPLAALPYVVAWAIWSAGGYGAFALGLRQLADRRIPVLVLLAPAAAVNLFFGQNGLYVTALLAGGVGLLERRPLMAGVLLGLLACKPQFAVLVPLLLMITGRWRVLAAAAASQALLAGGALLLLGVGPWIGFIDRMLHPMSVIRSSSSDWRAVPSLMTFARTCGLGPGPATALHWVGAAAAALTAAWAWRRTADPQMRAATAGAATVLISPYLRAYDLALLLPSVWLLATAPPAPSPSATRVRWIELTVAGLAWLAPVVLMFTVPPVQYGALLSAAALTLLAWRLQFVRQDVSNSPDKRAFLGKSSHR